MQEEIKRLEKITKDLRVLTFKMMKVAGSGHVGGSMSIAELIAVLYFNEMNINKSDPNDPDRDRFVLSKGHGGFTQYAALSMIGYIDEKELYRPYKVDSPIQGHPELGVFPGIDFGTGPLGQGISAAVGMAVGARIQKKDFRVYTIIGDGESHEGQVWEAAMSAAHYKLDNLVAFLDYNKLSLTGPIDSVMSLGDVPKKWESFGWHVMRINGHSVSEILESLKEAKEIKGKPVMIICDTVKGKGIAEYENQWNCHAVVLTEEQSDRYLHELENIKLD